MQSTTDNKKVRRIFQTKKGFITCSKLMINKLVSSPTRSKNAYFANNEQSSIAVFTAVFCLKHAKHNNWLAQTVNSVLCEIQRSQSNSKKPIKSPLKISQSFNVK